MAQANNLIELILKLLKDPVALARAKRLPPQFAVVGVGRTAMPDEEFRAKVLDGGTSVQPELTDGYRCWWSYVPHFINTPGYVYAYAYGQLLALSVYRRYEERGAEFVPKYLELLARVEACVEPCKTKRATDCKRERRDPSEPRRSLKRPQEQDQRRRGPERDIVA